MIYETIKVVLIALVCVATSQAFEPAEYFSQKCASCHTVGKGDDVGPDLKGVTKRRERTWLVRFVKESQSMIAEGDPIANELFVKFKRKKMPDQELDDSEVEELLAFIESGKVKDASAGIKSALDANPFDIKQGLAYFEGSKKLKNGGPSCLSCHSAGDAGFFGGGTLGPSLSHAYSSYNDKGLSKVLKSINFPTMVKVYKKHKLTDDEIYSIKSYLYTVDREAEHEHGYTKKFVFIGVIGFLLLLGMFDLIWKNRKKKKLRRSS